MKRALVVDDNRGDVTLMVQAVSESGVAIELLTAEGATRAFTFLRQQPVDALPHVIVLDLRMPVIDGLAALRIFKAEPAWSAIPVVVFSSSRYPTERAECLKAGAVCVQVKPQTWDQYLDLAKSLEAFLTRGCTPA
ncbi:MAG: response regulator [Planctomycetes bacterium]|nr:response regulator [Planctomycetota bacterium]